MAVTVLAARDLSGCPHRLALDHGVVAGQSGQPQPVADPASVRRRKEAAAAHRARVRDEMHGVFGSDGWVTVADGPAADAARATMAAMDSGARWIWNAVLPNDADGGRAGRCELLMASGSGYLPIIVVNHRVSTPRASAAESAGQSGDEQWPVTSPLDRWSPAPDPTRKLRNQRRDQLRLAHLTRMLQDLGSATVDRDAEKGGQDHSASALRGAVIGLDADCMVIIDLTAPGRSGPDSPSVLDDYDDRFAHAQRIASGLEPTLPSRVAECRSCRWFEKCGPELEALHDVSVVASGDRAEALRSIGIRTIDDLARYAGPPPERWPTRGGQGAQADLDDSVIMARAWLADVSLVRRVQEVSIPRADIEIDVDMESFGEDGAYLWGTLRTDTSTAVGRAARGAAPGVYRPFVTWDPLPTEDEARSFAEFWTWLMGEREAAAARGETFAAYCYSQQAENRWLLGSAKRFAGMPGIPPVTEVERFIASDQWVDVFEYVGRIFISPKGKGLKRIAPEAGFTWRDDEAGGEASMDWYQLAVGIAGDLVPSDPAARTTPDLSQRARLLEYNEDDVRATKALREWMDSPAVQQVPHINDL